MSNYKQIKELGSTGKMQVTPLQSEALQKALFEMGYLYLGTETNIIQGLSRIVWFISLGDKIFGPATKMHFEHTTNPLHLFDNHFEINP